MTDRREQCPRWHSRVSTRCSQSYSAVAFNWSRPLASRGQRGTKTRTRGTQTDQGKVGHDEMSHGGDNDCFRGNPVNSRSGGQEGSTEGGLGS
jgi:hypothetical protein